jgi:uncharacterized protein YaiL (DUF2058 family)
MSNSLQDQLLKAGLVNEKKLKQHKRSKKKQTKQQPKGQEVVNEASDLARKARAERTRLDRERNESLQMQAEQKAVVAQIRQMIEVNRIDHDRGKTGYQFVQAGKIKKMYVSDEQHAQLSRGQIAIVELDGGHELIPANIAAKINERQPDAVLLLHEKSTQPDDPGEDDPYADYPIPDDLMW